MSKLRLIEAITPSKIGGAEIFVANFCKYLEKKEVSFDLFCPQDRPFIEYAANMGIDSVSWKTSGKFDLITIIKLAKLIKSTNSNLINTHLSTASLLGALAAKLAGVKSVAHVHGLNTAICFRYSSHIIAVSNAVKTHLVGQGIDEDKISVWHNGVDACRFVPSDMSDAKQKLGYKSDTIIFGIFGRLSVEKGHLTALQAFSEVVKSHSDTLLLLIGNGSERELLESASENLGILSNVDFVGFKSDVREYMTACDAVIVPSLKEGFGLTAIEAMAMQKPVVASRTGGLIEIVLENETGLLFTPQNSLELADKLNQLIKSADTTKDMGIQARNRAIEHFNFEKQADKLIDIFKSLI